MADENFGIVVEINPRPALAGTGQIDRALAQNENSARDFEKAAKQAMAEVEKSARAAATAQEKAAKDAARAATAAVRAASKEQEESARAVTISAERRAKERSAAEIEASRKAAAAAKYHADLWRAAEADKLAIAKFVAAERARADKAAAEKSAAADRQRGAAAKAAADQQKQAQAGLAAAYRQIVGPAAEYQQKLAQIIQLERQGAISAKQRAQAIAGMGREMRQHSAQQRGGVSGALSGLASSQLGALAAPAAVVAVGVGAVKGAIELSDSYQTLTNKIRAVTESENEAIRVRGELLRISNTTRVSTADTASVYGRMASAGQALGKSQREVLTFTESLSKAVKVSGATANEATAGMIQLAQGLGAGALRGDELRSVLEQLPYVADVIARSLGVTRGQLRLMGEQGKITSEVVFKAFADMRGEIDNRFAKSVATVSDLMTVARNVMTDVVGSLVEATGVVPLLAKAFELAGQAALRVASDIKSLIGMIKEFDSATGGILGKLAKLQLGVMGKGLSFGYETSVFGMAGKVATRDLADAADAWEEYRAKLKKEQAEDLRNAELLKFTIQDPVARRKALEEFGKISDKFVAGITDENKALAARKAASQDAARAQRELTEEWTAWKAAVGEGTGGVIERLGDRVRATIDPMREFGAEVAANYAEVEKFNEAVGGLASRAFGKLRGAGDGIADGVTKSVDAMAEAIENATPKLSLFAETMAEQVGGALRGSLDLLVDWASGADASVSEFARSIAISMAKAMASLLAFQALKAAVGGAGNGGAGTFAGALAGALGFGNFAAGGSFTVPTSGGGGGVDSTPVAFRATPGERVTITPPGGGAVNARQAAPVVNVNPTIVFDPREALAAALRSPGGHQMVIDIIANNPSAVRAALSR